MREPNADDYMMLHDRLNTVSVVLWGFDGRNGIRSEVRKNTEEIKHLDSRLRRHEEVGIQMMAIWTTVRWLGLAMAGLIGFALTSPVSTVLARFIWALP